MEQPPAHGEVDAVPPEPNSRLAHVARAVTARADDIAAAVKPRLRGTLHAITAPVAPGTTMSVDLDYSIQNTSCPGCIEQILVGFTHGGGPQCAFNGVSGSPGKTGTASLTFTAPWFFHMHAIFALERF